MSTEIRSILANKHILILGFGIEGQSTYTLIRSYFPLARLSIADRDGEIFIEHPQLKNDAHLVLYSGEDYLRKCKDVDLVVKSPGIPFDLVTEYFPMEKITSQTDLFLRAYADRVIGVTGTKGKSTTCTLIYHLMKHSGRNVVLSGNIGLPPFNLISEIDPDTIVVFEMSSHQLEHISIAPQTAVILNLFPEHLDRYKDFTAYKMAKINISSMQNEGGRLIYHADDKYINKLILDKEEEQLLAFSENCNPEIAACSDREDIIIRLNDEVMTFTIPSDTDLPGEHNRMNLMAALLVSVLKGLTREEILEAIKTYRRPEHRLENAGVFDGVTFYNDSIATIPEACVAALQTLDRVDLLILGGYDRGLEYQLLYERLKAQPVPLLLFMGDAGKRMYREYAHKLLRNSQCYLIEGMEAGFDLIRKELKEGDVCLLSPAAASYGMFKNFEERGEVYKKMAADLNRPPSV